MSKYKSRYTEKLISAPQLVAEKISENIAKKNKDTLPNHFWELEKYKKSFLRQIFAANKILKVFSLEAILAGLNECKGAYSLTASFLIEAIKKHQDILSKKEERMGELRTLEVGKTTEAPRAPLGNKSILDKLD